MPVVRRTFCLCVGSLLLATCRPTTIAVAPTQSAGSQSPVNSQVIVDATVLVAAAAPDAVDSLAALAAWPALPEQHAAWSGTQQEELDRAAQWLFDHGMPDPRGLEYVRARVTVGELWSGAGQSVEAEGWLYRGPDQRPWFLGWNGTLYEPDAILGPADLDAMVAAFTTRVDRDAAVDPALGAHMARFHRARTGEAGALVPDALDALTHVLMARLGHRAARPLDPQFTAFESVVAAWQWALFDRAVCAHMRGDDLTSLRVSSVLVAARAAYAQRSVRASVDAGVDGPLRRDETDFAVAAESLQREARRRLARGPRARSVVVSSDAGAPRASQPTAVAVVTDRAASAHEIEQRVRAIIDELEDVDARQWGQPGGVDLASDARVRALIAIGEPAVPALIDALERDARLTRSVHFWRDFSRHRSLLGVHEAAYTAIAVILRQDFFRIVATGDDLSGRGESGRAALARVVREYWERHRAMPLHERAWAVLADDGATPEQWSNAGQNLCDRDEDRAPSGSMVGEPLRSRSGPSVSELFERRVLALLSTPRDAHDRYLRRTAALALSEQFARWEPRSPRLRTITERWFSAEQNEDTVRCIAALFAVRDRAGDSSVPGEYARWIVTVPASDVRSSVLEALEVAVRHPSDPAIMQATARVLSDRGWFTDEVLRWLDPPEWTPILTLAAARAWVRQRLTQRAEIGRIDVRQTGFELRYRDGGAMSSTTANAGLQPGTWPWRACDDLAFRVVQTQAERDALMVAPARREPVIEALRRRLSR